MPSNIQIPKIKKDYKMAESGFKSLIGRRMNKSFKFMGEDVKINKLSVEQVLEIQELAAAVNNSNAEAFALIRKVIKMSVEGTDDISDEDFGRLPMDELTKLSNEIMKFSGLGGETGKA